MKILYKSAFVTEELKPDVALKTLPGKACIEIHKVRNESGYDLLYNGTIIDPETNVLECNGEGELIVRKDGDRHVFSVKSVASSLPVKYVKAYEQFHYEYQNKKLDEIESIQAGGLRLYAVDQSTEVYDWSDTFKQIEESFSAFKTICEKPKSHLKAVNEVRPIETVKRIGYESIPYLAAHSEDWLARTASGLKPARLFSRVEDDEFQIYENRVVKTLTDLILGFLRRTEKQLRDQRDQLRGIMNSGVQTGSFGFDVSFQKAVSELMSSDTNGEERRSKSLELVEKQQEWAYRLLKKYRALRQTRLYRYLRKSKPVQNPLNETNILVMDKHYSVIFRLWKTIHHVVAPRSVEDEIQIPFNEVFDDYLLFCSTLCGYATHILNFELVEDGRYIRENDNIEIIVDRQDEYIRVVLTDKERHSVEIGPGVDIPIKPGEMYPNRSGFSYDGRLLSWPNDISENSIDEFCSLFKTKESRGKEQSEEKRKYNAIKSIITQKHRSYPAPGRTSFMIIPADVELGMENRSSFRENITTIVDNIHKKYPGEDIIVALPLCNDNEQKITEYAKEKGQSVSVLPLTMFDINSFRRIQNVLYRHILKLEKGKCLNCGGTVRKYDNHMVCDACNYLTLTKTICPNSNCKHEYYYLNYDVSEDTISRMREVKRENFFQWDSLYQYKDIVNIRLDGGKIRPICPCCHQG